MSEECGFEIAVDGDWRLDSVAEPFWRRRCSFGPMDKFDRTTLAFDLVPQGIQITQELIRVVVALHDDAIDAVRFKSTSQLFNDRSFGVV